MKALPIVSAVPSRLIGIVNLNERKGFFSAPHIVAIGPDRRFTALQKYGSYRGCCGHAPAVRRSLEAE
jgi:hypothetical protein